MSARSTDARDAADVRDATDVRDAADATASSAVAAGAPRRVLSVAVAVAVALALALTLSSSSEALAQRLVALAPLATLGSEDTSQGAQAATAQLEQAIAALPGTSVVPAAQVAAALRRGKRQGPAACDGDLACIAELGRQVGAAVLVTGQLGGLGEARVIYLGAVDTTTGKELGSTTWSTGQGDSAAAAVVRLLAPAEYVGKLQLRLPIQSAVIYVNGRKLPASTTGTHSLPVGTHALRVTHPEVRDFVRFVDISYGAITQVDVVLTPLPVVQHDVEARQAAARAGSHRPWYRTWWAVAGGAGLAAVLAGVVTYSLADNFDPDVTLP